jgi:hypothetical protein
MSDSKEKVFAYYHVARVESTLQRVESDQCDRIKQAVSQFYAEPVSEFVEDDMQAGPVFERHQSSRKKAIAYITVSSPPKWKQCEDVIQIKSSLLFNQRESIERKAAAIGADIVGEFVIPKASNTITGSQFRKMLDFISTQGVDYVVIYTERPHRVYKESALIEAAIIQAGAQLVSVQEVESAPELLRSFLRKA